MSNTQTQSTLTIDSPQVASQQPRSNTWAEVQGFDFNFGLDSTSCKMGKELDPSKPIVANALLGSELGESPAVAFDAINILMEGNINPIQDFSSEASLSNFSVTPLHGSPAAIDDSSSEPSDTSLFHHDPTDAYNEPLSEYALQPSLKELFQPSGPLPMTDVAPAFSPSEQNQSLEALKPPNVPSYPDGLMMQPAQFDDNELENDSYPTHLLNLPPFSFAKPEAEFNTSSFYPPVDPRQHAADISFPVLPTPSTFRQYSHASGSTPSYKRPFFKMDTNFAFSQAQQLHPSSHPLDDRDHAVVPGSMFHGSNFPGYASENILHGTRHDTSPSAYGFASPVPSTEQVMDSNLPGPSTLTATAQGLLLMNSSIDVSAPPCKRKALEKKKDTPHSKRAKRGKVRYSPPNRCDQQSLAQGIPTCTIFNCSWGTCTAPFDMQTYSTPAAFREAIETHMEGHLSGLSTSAGLLHCLWKGCKVSTEWLTTLKRHVKGDDHGYNLRFFCPACDAAFTRRDALVNHRKRCDRV
ncbi:hypothetical protein H0H92_009785 [Tricholoma furcatifolium]|nr:hypothetical protein H0H92_009785 [Tricholoma furcatifolium]